MVRATKRQAENRETDWGRQRESRFNNMGRGHNQVSDRTGVQVIIRIQV